MAFGTQFVTNAGNLAAKKRALAGMAEERFRSVARAEGDRMKAIAVKLSSGNLSLAQLRRLGYPYASRLPQDSAPYPDYIVNIQSRDFVDGWKSQVRLNSNDWTISLINTSRHAAFMMGTDKMRPRLILSEVMRQAYPSLPAEARVAVRSVIAANGSSAPTPSGSGWGGLAYGVSVGITSLVGSLEGSIR